MCILCFVAVGVSMVLCGITSGVWHRLIYGRFCDRAH